MPASSRGHRFAGRARVVARALARRVSTLGRREPPREPRRILIAHHLLLGDTLMLTSLLAKLRARHPAADIVMALPEAFAPLYQSAPYGVRALGWNPRAPARSPLWRERGFDLAFVPGDNRVSWLAQALGSRWIVGFDGDRPAPQELADRRAASLSGRAGGVDRHGRDAGGGAAAGAVRKARLARSGRRSFRIAARPLRGAARRRQHAAQALGAGQVARARGMARRARHRAGMVGGTRRGSDRARMRSRCAVSLVRRRADAAAALAAARQRRAAGRARYRRCPSGARRFGTDGRAVRSGFGVDQRRRPFLARCAVSRGDRRSVPVPRSAGAVQARDRVGAPLRTRNRRVPAAALHGSDRSRAGLRRDRRPGRRDA